MTVLYSLEPIGNTGGRVYLRMVHAALADLTQLRTLDDPKRRDPVRRWRKLRHLSALAPEIDNLEVGQPWYLWDDLSLLLFTPTMLRRTVFIFHHHEPRQYDSAPIESALWTALFTALRNCAAVVCVAPYWQRYLAARGVHATVIHNGFDLAEIDDADRRPRSELKATFDLPADTIAVYAGKAARWKGVDNVVAALANHTDITVVSSGVRATRTSHRHLELPRSDYLQLIRTCDVGVFASQMAEGWSRCSAEAILLGLPCLLADRAGLGDLGRLTSQPTPDFTRLDEQIRGLAAADTTATVQAAQRRLRPFDALWFTDRWRSLFSDTVRAGHGPFDSLIEGTDGFPELVREGGPWT